MSNTPNPLRRVEDLLKDGNKRFDALEQRLESVESKTKNRKVGAPASGEKQVFTAAKWYRDALEGERKPLRIAVRADLAFGTDNIGGYVVPEQQERTIIEELGARLVVAQSGATMRTGLSGSPYKEPKIASSATAYWKAENAAATESNPTFGEVSMTPKTCIALTVMSRESAMLSDPALEGVVRNHLGRVIGRALDASALEGSGSGGEPQGLEGLGGSINSVAIGGAPTVDDLYDMLYEVELDNADEGKLGWVIHPRDMNTIRQLKDGNSNYLLQPAIAQGQPSTLLGFPVRTSTQIDITGGAGTESTIYFGNWADLIWGQWGVIEVTASTEAEDFYSNNQLGVRAVVYTDFGVRHDESFCLGTGVTP